MRTIITAGLLALLTGACALEGKVALAGAGAVVAVNDADGDGYLDAAEVQAMVARSMPPATLTGGFWDALRAAAVAAYWSRDLDRDGRLSVAELAQ